MLLEEDPVILPAMYGKRFQKAITITEQQIVFNLQYFDE